MAGYLPYRQLEPLDSQGHEGILPSQLGSCLLTEVCKLVGGSGKLSKVVKIILAYIV